MAERLNLPLSNVKGSISIGMAGTAWAPALENIPALTEEGWTWTASSVWFGFCCFWGQNFQAEVPGIRHQTPGTPAWYQWSSCSALTASWRKGRWQVPQPQGKVISLYPCWGAQQRPFTPEVLNKSPWIQKASYLGVKIKPWIASLGTFENLAFESLNMFMPRSFPCEIM